MSDPLERLGRRVEQDQFFLASLLAEYARAERLDDSGLAQALGCQPETLTGIRLCRAPRPDPAGFREDLRQVAERFGLDVGRLRDVMREAEALRRLREGATGAPGFLMAARDRPEEPPPAEDPRQ
jgi:hypothetical protein